MLNETQQECQSQYPHKSRQVADDLAGEEAAPIAAVGRPLEADVAEHHGAQVDSDESSNSQCFHNDAHLLWVGFGFAGEIIPQSLPDL